MKIHFDPLGKGKKKPDLEETVSNPIEETGKEEQGNGKRMVIGFRLSKDAVSREAKPGYKAGNESIDDFNEESKEYKEEKKYEEGKLLSEEEYKQKIREAYFEGNEYLRKGDKEKAAEKFDTALKLYSFLQALNKGQVLKDIILQQEAGKEDIEDKITEEKTEEKIPEEKVTEERKQEKQKEQRKETEEIRIGYSPFSGLYFKDTAKEKEKGARTQKHTAAWDLLGYDMWDIAAKEKGTARRKEEEKRRKEEEERLSGETERRMEEITRRREEKARRREEEVMRREGEEIRRREENEATRMEEKARRKEEELMRREEEVRRHYEQRGEEAYSKPKEFEGKPNLMHRLTHPKEILIEKKKYVATKTYFSINKRPWAIPFLEKIEDEKGVIERVETKGKLLWTNVRIYLANGAVINFNGLSRQKAKELKDIIKSEDFQLYLNR